MAYCTFAQLQTTYSLALLDRLCTRAHDADQDTPPDTEGRSEDALEAAAGQMDTFFAGSYPVPLLVSAPSTAAVLRECNAVLAVSNLVRQLGYTVGSEDEQLVKAAYYWLDWLASVRNGKTSLPGVSLEVTQPDQVAPSTGFYIMSEEPFFPPADRFA